MLGSTVTTRWLRQWRPTRRIHAGLYVSFIGALFAGTAMVVYATGGTKLAWPYLVLIPVLIAATRFRLVGGAIGGLVGGLLLGPMMPLDVDAGIAQETNNWVIRLAFYVGLGAFTGLLFQLKHRESQLREVEVRTDLESGLPNKTALMEAVDDFPVSGSDDCPLLLLVRVTHLFEVIEVAGATGADELMRELAGRLRRCLGEPVQIYRFSASELMVVRPPPVHNTPEEVAEQAGRSVIDPIEVRTIPVHADLVMGSAGGAVSVEKPRELIGQVRTALVAAMENEWAHCHYSRDLERESAHVVKLLAGVRHGLQENQFELYYQPRIRADQGNIAGCEALIRWHDHDGSIIPPGEFMPRVERSALIAPLTRFVVASACEFARQRELRPVSINFTARNLLDRDLITVLSQAAADNHLGVDSIEIEITEGAIIRDPASARVAIEKFREHGFRVSLDDFGTGYSSFEYLRLLPLTGLKIDRSFVGALDSDPRAEQLMACMIQVGHALDLEVVAEGVETVEQANVLRRLDCDLLQGFYFSRPMTGEDYRKWYGKNAGRALLDTAPDGACSNR